MRQILGTIIVFLLAYGATAQFTIKGKITSGKIAVEGATVSLKTGSNELTSQPSLWDGTFEITNIKKHVKNSNGTGGVCCYHREY
jgi:hypothetical protein